MRTIVIGDIHGCLDELIALLDKLALSESDRVVSVGDIVRKGPDPVGCLDLWKQRGYLAVQGNHETRVLDRRGQLLQRYFGDDAPLLRRLDLIEWMEKWPKFFRFEEERIIVVHGGVLPEGLDAMSSDAREHWLPRLRYVRRTPDGWQPMSKSESAPDDQFWTSLWNGPETVVYGHTPRSALQRDPFAIGIDTGCVYGNALTAAVFEESDWSFVSVKAKRAYAARSSE